MVAPARAKRPLPLRRISDGARRTTTSRASGTRLKRKSFSVLEWKRSVLETMITPSRARATMLSSVCETSVPSEHREGLAHAADPPRQGHRPRRLAEARRQRRRHQHADHRRRGDVAAAHRPVGQRGAHDPVPGGGAEEERERHQRAGDQDPGEVGADDAGDDLVDADLLRGEDGEAGAEGPGDAEADAARDTPAAAAALGQGRVERGQPARRARRAAVGGSDADPVGDALARAGRRGRLDRALVDTADAIGDAGPGVALGALPGSLAHRREALRLVVGALQLLGEALRIAGRDEDAVDDRL